MVRPAVGAWRSLVRLTVAEDAADAAATAARRLVEAVLEACAARGRAVIAVSGGTTPWQMLRVFVRASLPWESVHVAQVDERCVPRDDPRRNLQRLERILVHDGPLPAANLLAMPVDVDDEDRAARDYAAALAAVTGTRVTLDLVQLGLGTDGHTASLVPGDPVLDIRDAPVGYTRGPYEGARRMTLTFATLADARERLWLVTGRSKRAALAALLAGAADSPAVRVPRTASVVIADREATGDLPTRPP